MSGAFCSMMKESWCGFCVLAGVDMEKVWRRLKSSHNNSPDSHSKTSKSKAERGGGVVSALGIGSEVCCNVFWESKTCNRVTLFPLSIDVRGEAVFCLDSCVHTCILFGFPFLLLTLHAHIPLKEGGEVTFRASMGSRLAATWTESRSRARANNARCDMVFKFGLKERGRLGADLQMYELGRLGIGVCKKEVRRA